MESDTCLVCRSKNSRSAEEAIFHSQSLRYTVSVREGECKECVIKSAEGILREFVDLFLLLPVHIRVNWGYYEALSEMRDSRDYLARIHDFLETIGILTREAEGNWAIVSETGMNLTPAFDTVQYFFTQLQDAREYACRMLKHPMCSWEIQNAGQSFSQDFVLSGVSVG